MRQLKIDSVIHNVDFSDGKGLLPSSYNGLDGMKLIIDGRQKTDNFVIDPELRDLAFSDGVLDYDLVVDKSRPFSYRYILRLNPNELKWIRNLPVGLRDDEGNIRPECEYPMDSRLDELKKYLTYFKIESIEDGYHFGKELYYDDICITFDKDGLVVYSRHHHGYIAWTAIEINSDHPRFEEMIRLIKDSVLDFVDLINIK